MSRVGTGQSVLGGEREHRSRVEGTAKEILCEACVPRGSGLPDGAKPAVPGTWLGALVVVHVARLAGK